MDHKDKIKALEEELNRLKAKQAKFDLLPENQRLADILHEFDCMLNHTDQCDYHYCEWHNAANCYGKQKYLKKANLLLGQFSFETVQGVITVLDTNN